MHKNPKNQNTPNCFLNFSFPYPHLNPRLCICVIYPHSLPWKQLSTPFKQSCHNMPAKYNRSNITWFLYHTRRLGLFAHASNSQLKKYLQESLILREQKWWSRKNGFERIPNSIMINFRFFYSLPISYVYSNIGPTKKILFSLNYYCYLNMILKPVTPH